MKFIDFLYIESCITIMFYIGLLFAMRHYNVPIFHQLIILLVTDKILGIIKIPLDDYIFKNYIDKKEYEKTIEKYILDNKI